LDNFDVVVNKSRGIQQDAFRSLLLVDFVVFKWISLDLTGSRKQLEFPEFGEAKGFLREKAKA